jgi:hypothetical protein
MKAFTIASGSAVKIFQSKCFFLLAALLLSAAVAQAQLLVSVSPPKTTGSKTLVKLEMVNQFSEPVESARAVCFLLDERGKMVGQSTQWVIGAVKERPALQPGKTNVFHFVIPSENLSSTNLSPKVSFSRVILEGGKLADVNAGVKVENAAK